MLIEQSADNNLDPFFLHTVGASSYFDDSTTTFISWRLDDWFGI